MIDGIKTFISGNFFTGKVMRKKGWDNLIATGKKHVREEGENLKKILER